MLTLTICSDIVNNNLPIYGGLRVNKCLDLFIKERTLMMNFILLPLIVLLMHVSFGHRQCKSIFGKWIGIL